MTDHVTEPAGTLAHSITVNMVASTFNAVEAIAPL